MYDKPVKWIHFGLQESSLINSDIYSHGFNAAVPPPVKHGAEMAGSSDAIRGVICFAVLQRGAGKKASLGSRPSCIQNGSSACSSPFRDGEGKLRLDVCVQILHG